MAVLAGGAAILRAVRRIRPDAVTYAESMTSLALGIPGIRRDPARLPLTAGRPDDARLLDQFGRTARDLLISIT